MSRKPYDRIIKMIFLLLNRMESLLQKTFEEGDLRAKGGDIKLQRTGSGGGVSVLHSEKEAEERVHRPDKSEGEGEERKPSKEEDESRSPAELALERFEEKRKEETNE